MNLKCIISWFSVYSYVIQLSPLSNSRTIPSPQKETSYFSIPCTLPPSNILATINLFVSIDLPNLDISYNWVNFYETTSFSQHEVFKLHPCYRMSVHCPLLWLSNIPLHSFLPIYPSVDGRLDCFHSLVIMNNAAVYTYVHIFSSLEYTYEWNC